LVRAVRGCPPVGVLAKPLPGLLAQRSHPTPSALCADAICLFPNDAAVPSLSIERSKSLRQAGKVCAHTLVRARVRVYWPLCMHLTMRAFDGCVRAPATESGFPLSLSLGLVRKCRRTRMVRHSKSRGHARCSNESRPAYVCVCACVCVRARVCTRLFP
jgi:hypothetical protein